MNKFNVGDKVKAVKQAGNDQHQIEVGEEFIVKKLSNPYSSDTITNLQVEGDKNESAWYSAELFFLVKESESELEELVRKANEGYKAAFEIRRNFKNKVEFKPINSGDFGALSDGSVAIPAEFRIKPLPKFESFTVGNNWEVKFSEVDAYILIGCKAFNAGELWYALENLTKNSTTQNTVSGNILSAIRGGIVCNGKESISWSEAEKIRDALDKVLS